MRSEVSRFPRFLEFAIWDHFAGPVKRLLIALCTKMMLYLTCVHSDDVAEIGPTTGTESLKSFLLAACAPILMLLIFKLPSLEKAWGVAFEASSKGPTSI